MRSDDKMVILVLLIIVGSLLLAALQPYFEARTFNKFSKTKATYLDALVSELRVFPDGSTK